MAGTFEFAYTSPDMTESGDRVTWDWTATNTGRAPVFEVVLTSTVTPKALQIATASGHGDTTIARNTATTRFAKVEPGAKLTGTLVVPLPEGLSGTVQINGRAVWRD